MKSQNKVLSQWFKDSKFYAELFLTSEEKIIKAGENQALRLFLKTASQVPAYRDFLKHSKIKVAHIKSIKDFRKIPPITKENYIDKYSLKDRCWDGKLENLHMISTSSGTTSKPHYWPRDLQTEIEGAYPHELLLKNICNIDKCKTLFINGFAMGNWIAGTFTLACINLVAWKGYPITVMTPGYSLEAVLETVENLNSDFEQIIICGHTPFLKEVIEVVNQKKLINKKIKVILFGTGQGITENWRGYILKLLNSKDYYQTFFNLYGSAEAALMGFESPSSIRIRKYLSDNIDKSKAIFNDERLPSLYNFDPRLTFIESNEGELWITKYSSAPLIRYNIHDNGGVFAFSKLKSLVKTNLNIPWRLPFVYLFGREKFMVKIYGANVYSEHVQFALNHQTLQPFLTGRFVLEQEYDKRYNPQMICRIELNIGIDKSDDLQNKIREIFISEVRKINSEYNDVLGRMGEKVKPKIILHIHGDEKYFPKDKIKKTA